ncbi:hypothetical protein LBR03_00940 [Levilactobacillus brevis]|nr:hypothetical protein LBR03_00940 [Levilactobacillus brevis]
MVTTNLLVVYLLTELDAIDWFYKFNDNKHGPQSCDYLTIKATKHGALVSAKIATEPGLLPSQLPGSSAS